MTGASNLALAIAAAEAFLGRPVDPHAADDVALPGRLERRGEQPLEIWDGAHNLAGVGYLLPRLPDREYVLVCSILARQAARADARGAVRPREAHSSPRSRRMPARSRQGTSPSAPNRISAMSSRFPIPAEARSRALALAGPEGAVVVTGSLYLLAELSGHGYDP